MIQMLPSASAAALDTWPSVHPFGMCGQDGSTTNFGTSMLLAGRGGAAEIRRDPAIISVTIAAITTPALAEGKQWRVTLPPPGRAIGAQTRFRFTNILILSFGSPSHRADSAESTTSIRICDFDLWLVHRTILLLWTQ